MWYVFFHRMLYVRLTIIIGRWVGELGSVEGCRIGCGAGKMRLKRSELLALIRVLDSISTPTTNHDYSHPPRLSHLHLLPKTTTTKQFYILLYFRDTK